VVIGHHAKIETVPQRVARAALQLDETGVNGNSFHAQNWPSRQDKRAMRPVQIPPRARWLNRPGFVGAVWLVDRLTRLREPLTIHPDRPVPELLVVRHRR
jgi:hypothetical protein